VRPDKPLPLGYAAPGHAVYWTLLVRADRPAPDVIEGDIDVLSDRLGDTLTREKEQLLFQIPVYIQVVKPNKKARAKTDSLALKDGAKTPRRLLSQWAASKKSPPQPASTGAALNPAEYLPQQSQPSTVSTAEAGHGEATGAAREGEGGRGDGGGDAAHNSNSRNPGENLNEHDPGRGCSDSAGSNGGLDGKEAGGLFSSLSGAAGESGKSSDPGPAAAFFSGLARFAPGDREGPGSEDASSAGVDYLFGDGNAGKSTKRGKRVADRRSYLQHQKCSSTFIPQNMPRATMCIDGLTGHGVHAVSRTFNLHERFV
jgi:hypothetical protein